ncbi:S8 family serine peptidase [Neobacillus vireti]|uniref:S8 family serine peptidase n=1 Tax=Neobacillus vireti TaxID=220686 RepID=UPI0038B3AAAB
MDLYAYRVLGAYGSGANSGIIAAIDKAVQEKMDVINLSLGSTSNSQTSSDAIAINNAVLNGVTAVVATGNSGPNRGTIGSPSTAPLRFQSGTPRFRKRR